MTVSSERADATLWNPWRIGRWTSALALLSIPAVMMQVSDEWHWTPGSFAAAGIVFGGLLLLYELAERMNGSRAYRAGIALILLASFLLVWTTIVRDDGNGIGFFLVIMAVPVGAFACRFAADGMARTLFGVAVMQALFGLAVATAPVTARIPDGPVMALAYSGFFTVLWLISAAAFRAAARS